MEVQQPNPRGISLCIRIVILYNTDRAQSEMRHAYLRGAQAIKQDLDQMRQVQDVMAP
jgi:chorismate mutase